MDYVDFSWVKEFPAAITVCDPDEWDTIWNHELAIRLRERKGLPEKCSGCALLSECGGGCPLQFPSNEKQALS